MGWMLIVFWIKWGQETLKDSFPLRKLAANQPLFGDFEETGSRLTNR